MSDATAAIPLLEEPKNNHQWRPPALYTPALISFIGLCVGLLLISELVTFGCSGHDGCYVFGSSQDGNLPLRSIFVYTAIPTILSISLSLRWYVVHHDIIRLEPYYQMSRESGAKASNSLFLEYSYELIFFLPYKAIMKKHYIVALSSSILLVMNYALVPLVGRVFDDSITSSSLVGSATRIDYKPSAERLPGNFTFSAYEYAWRDGALSPFMTEEYALLPVRPLDQHPPFLPRENWTVETTLFEAELECSEAYNVSFGYGDEAAGGTSFVVKFYQNEKSSQPVKVCDALAQEFRLDEVYISTQCSDMAAFVTPWTSMYAMLGAEVDPALSYMFAWATGPNSPPHITASTRSPTPDLDNITAIFCTPRYYTQNVNIAISMPSGEVDQRSLRRLGERTRMNPLEGFHDLTNGNLTRIYRDTEFLMEGSGLVQEPKTPLRFGYAPDYIVDLKHDLLERFGNATRPAAPQRYVKVSKSNVFMGSTNTLAAFALYSKSNDSATLRDLLDPKELESTIKKALKLWFAFAVASECARGNGSSTIAVEREIPQHKITINQSWLLGARMGLPLLLVLAALLIYLIEKRPCHLSAEPNTMASALSLLSASPALCAVMQDAEYYPIERLMKWLDEQGFYFRMCLDNAGSSQIRVFREVEGNMEEVLEPYEDLNVLRAPTADSRGSRLQEWAGQLQEWVSPLLGRGNRLQENDDQLQVQNDAKFISPDLVVVCNLVLFPIIIAVLLAAYELSKKNNGFPMPDDPNSFWSKVIFGYVPVLLVGTMAETLLIMLGTSQCMMAPYKALMTKRAKFSEAITVDYDRTPPHFQLFNSFRSLKTGQITLVVLSLTILLSNVLAVLMSGFFIHSSHVLTIPKPHDQWTRFRRVHQGIFFQLERNLTSGDSPSWTTDEFYIDSPFTIAPLEEMSTYNTRGFGLDINCTVVPEAMVTYPCGEDAKARNNSVEVNKCKELRFQDGDSIIAFNTSCARGVETSLYTFWSGTSVDFILTDPSCPDRIFPVWAQNNRYTGSEPFVTQDDYRFVVLNCSVADRITDLRATVRHGKVLSVKHLADVSLKSSDENSTPSLALSFIGALMALVDETKLYGNHPLDRINWLMAQVYEDVVQSTKTHVPSVEFAAEAFEDVLTRLFVLLARLYAEEMFEVEYSVNLVENRAYIVKVNFALALVVLVFCFCVVVNVYANHARMVMGHLPWSLAGLYSHLYASNAKGNVVWDGKVPKERDTPGDYAYGEYPEELGKHHGVYRNTEGDGLDPLAVEQE